MAELVIDDTTVRVELSALERAGAVRLDDLVVDRAAVTLVRSTTEPFGELRGLRAPGTGFPGRIALGTWRGRFGKDFVSIRGHDAEAVVIELTGAPWARLVVGVDDATPVLAALRA